MVKPWHDDGGAARPSFLVIVGLDPTI